MLDGGNEVLSELSSMIGRVCENSAPISCNGQARAWLPSGWGLSWYQAYVDSDPRACHAVVLWQKTIGVGFGKDKPAPVSQVRHTHVPDRGLLLQGPSSMLGLRAKEGAA